MSPFRTRTPAVLTPWRWLDLVIFFVAAIVVIATSFRVRVYYKVPESPVTGEASRWNGEPLVADRETPSGASRVA